MHHSYKASLPFAVCLQAILLTFAYTVSPQLFLCALIPAAAYWIITPIIILRHPQPSRLDLQLVRTGYAFYCIFSMFIAIVFAYLRK